MTGCAGWPASAEFANSRCLGPGLCPRLALWFAKQLDPRSAGFGFRFGTKAALQSCRNVEAQPLSLSGRVPIPSSEVNIPSGNPWLVLTAALVLTWSSA